MLDTLWLLVSVALVFLMQAGFLCLETGLTRSKNNINVAMKNLTDLAVSMMMFWLCGYAFMFGASRYGWLGLSHFSLDFSTSPSPIIAFFLFQTMFCAVSVTILSGAVAERIRFAAYLAIAVLVSTLIYPIFGHWAWNGAEMGLKLGWLGQRGFIDFAGSSVVHSVGGWVSLAALLIIGPRLGKFAPDGTPQHISGANLPLATLGTMLLWLGWFGFNGGSTLALTDQVPMIIGNTILAGGAGLIGVLLVGWFIQGKADAGLIMNGSLAGLVAITANPFAVSTASAVMVGLIGGLVMLAVTYALEWRQIDDTVGAIPVHLGAGIWGTLAVALFGQTERLNTGLTFWGQLEVQLLGIVVCFVWAFGLTYFILNQINRLWPLRVTEEMEHVGLNVTEHGATTELLDLFTVMEEQSKTGNLSLRVPVEPFTEVGQIAQRYNQVMQALEQAIAKTEAIVYSAMDGIITFSRYSRAITTLNPAAEAIFGYAQAQVVGQPITMLFFDAPVRESYFVEKLVATHKRHELVGQRLDGSTFPLEVMLTEAKAGDDVFYTGIFRDITPQKEAEAQLQQKNHYLAALHDTTLGIINRLEVNDLLDSLMHRAIQLLDSKHGYIYLLTANEQALELRVGAGVFENHIGQSVKKGEGLSGHIWQTEAPLIVPDYSTWPHRVMAYDEFKLSSSVGVPIQRQESTRTQLIGVLGMAWETGQHRPISSEEVDLLQRFAQLAAVALDNAHLYNESQRARQVAEEANEAKSSFLANVSHELRTPLTSVLGFAKLIEKRLDTLFANLDPTDTKVSRNVKQVKQNVGIIVSEGERLTSLINNVLDLAKIEAGRVEWNMQPLEIGFIIERATAATSALFEQKGIPCVIDIEPDLPLITGDKDRLIQVVINLLSNAIKFTYHGQITCQVRRVEQAVVVKVIDMGVGISSADQLVVFDKFKQVGDTLTDKPQGTGLGLPICKQIVEHHQGHIWVESQLGQGSTFAFTLPLENTDQLARSKTLDIDMLVKQLETQTLPVEKKSYHKTILVVDDDPHIRELLRQELEGRGYQVRMAHDGIEAINQVKRQKPDLITLDVMMPHMNGFDVAAILKNDPNTAAIPIIILSIVEDRERGYRIGVDRYLQKPIDTETLFTEVEHLLSQQVSHKKVLVVDENESAANMLSEILRGQGYQVVEVANHQDLIEKAIMTRPDMIIVNTMRFKQHHDLIKTLRFEKGMEDVLILFFQETEKSVMS